MQLKTILNRIQKHRGFVYGRVELLQEGNCMAMGVDIWPRAGSRAVCSGCGHRRPG